MLSIHSNITYNPLQELSAQYTSGDCNLVVIAPTSSGKTIVAEQFIYPVLQEGKKALYLSPLKAITSEKAGEWKQWGFPMAVITSDYANRSTVKEDLVLMTVESLDSKTRGAKSWLRNVGVLVVDEAHLLGSPSRGDALEMGLLRFASMNKDSRIIFLSASIGNGGQMCEWLTRLNGKPCELVSSSWRPVDLEYQERVSGDKEWMFDSMVLNLAKDVLRKERGQVLLFVHTVGKGRKYASSLGAPFHYSKLPKAERLALESEFKNRNIRLLVSTSTLAWGVNLPADIGIIAGAHRGPAEVSATELQQMAGRIGRYGLSKKGKVYFCLKSSYAERVWDSLFGITPVNSVLKQRLRFHVNSLLCREGIPPGDVQESFKLAFQPIPELAISIAMSQLQACQAIGSEFEPKVLGRASALFYLDPLDLYSFRAVMKDRPMTPELLARAFGQMPCFNQEASVPPDLQDIVEMDTGQATIVATVLRDWFSGLHLSSSGNAIIYTLKTNASRFVEALKMCLPSEYKPYLVSVGLALEVGTTLGSVTLAALPGIGRQRIAQLNRAGIYNKEQFVTGGKQVVGEVLYKKALEEGTFLSWS